MRGIRLPRKAGDSPGWDESQARPGLKPWAKLAKLQGARDGFPVTLRSFPHPVDSPAALSQPLLNTAFIFCHCPKSAPCGLCSCSPWLMVMHQIICHDRPNRLGASLNVTPNSFGRIHWHLKLCMTISPGRACSSLKLLVLAIGADWTPL